MDRPLTHDSFRATLPPATPTSIAVAGMHSLAPVLLELALRSASGCLRIGGHSNAAVELYLVDGFVVGLQHGASSVSLTQILVRRGRLDVATARALDRLAIALRRPVSSLIALAEIVSANQLDAARVELVHQVLHDVNLQPLPVFEFRDGAPPWGSEDGLMIAATEIFSELELRRETEERSRARYPPAANQRLTRTPPRSSRSRLS